MFTRFINILWHHKHHTLTHELIEELEMAIGTVTEEWNLAKQRLADQAAQIVTLQKTNADQADKIVALTNANAPGAAALSENATVAADIDATLNPPAAVTP